MGDVVSLNLPHAQIRLLEQDYEFTRGVDEALGCVAATLRDIEEGDSGRTGLHLLSTDLLNLLSCVERNPSIEMAVDHLVASARGLVAARQREGELVLHWHDELGLAYLRLRGRLAASRLSAKTQQSA